MRLRRRAQWCGSNLMKRIPVVGWLFVCFWWGPMVGAQEGSISLPPVVVTATRTPVPAPEAPGSVTVITREDLKRMGVTTVLEALREVPGLDVVQQGGPGRITSVFLRGANSDHALVLIDGIPVNSATTGGFDFADLPVDQVERIEIVRGPQSTLYGSDAMGGVIQILTGPDTRIRARVELEWGGLGTTRLAARTREEAGPWTLGLSASRLDVMGISAYAGGSERDPYHNTSLVLNLDRKEGGAITQWTAHVTQATAALDGFGSDDPNYIQTRRLALVGWTRHQTLRPGWTQTLRLSLSTDRLEGQDPDTSWNNYRVDSRLLHGEWQHRFQSSPSQELVLGYEWLQEQGENRGRLAHTLIHHSVYAQERRGMGTGLEALVGVRYDANTLYDDAFTWKILLAVTPPGGARWHVQYATGFKGPDLNDLFWPQDSFAKGNPDLRPEEVRGWEIGVRRTSGSLDLGVVYFHNRFRDLIEWRVDPSDGRYTPQNIARARSQGVEVSLGWAPRPGFRFGGTYTYDEAEDLEEQTYLIRRPLNRYTLSLDLGGERRHFRIRWLHVGRRLDAGSTLPAYNRVDVSGSFRLSDRVEATWRLENLFDVEYQEARDYGAPGFVAYGGLRMTL